MGLGAYPASGPQFLGMPGMHGTIEANNAMQNCDVLLAIGARFDDRVIGNPKHFAQNERKIIHIDIDPSTHLQAREGGHPDRRRRARTCCTELIAQIEREPSQARSRRPGRRGGSQIERVAQARLPEVRPRHQGRHQAAVRGRDAVENDQGRATPTSRPTWASTRCGPPSTTASTSRAAGSIPVAWAPWAWAFRTQWASSSRSPTRSRSASPAKARSRCASRSCRPASSTTDADQDRARSTTVIWAWCGSGSRSTTPAATAHSYMDALPNFVKLAEAYGHVGMLIERPQDVEPGAARGTQAQGPHGVHGLHYRPHRERVPDGARPARASPKCCWGPKISDARNALAVVQPVTDESYCLPSLLHYRARGRAREKRSHAT